jgi:hypothetical protein
MHNQERNSVQDHDQEYLRTPDAAIYLKISESQLNKLRMKKNRARGPKFANIAGCILYRRVDLDDWIVSKLSVA